MNIPTSSLWYPVGSMDLRAEDIVKARNYHKTSNFFLNKWLVNLPLKVFFSFAFYQGGRNRNQVHLKRVEINPLNISKFFSPAF